MPLNVCPHPYCTTSQTNLCRRELTLGLVGEEYTLSLRCHIEPVSTVCHTHAILCIQTSYKWKSATAGTYCSSTSSEHLTWLSTHTPPHLDTIIQLDRRAQLTYHCDTHTCLVAQAYIHTPIHTACIPAHTWTSVHTEVSCS